MLINTLFLFLRDLLPLFFIFSMLAAILPAALLWQVLLRGFALGLLLGLLLHLNAAQISQWWDGSGVEIIFFSAKAALLLGWIAFLLTTNNFQTRLSQWLPAFLLMLTVATSSFQLFTFFSTFANHNEGVKPLLLGMTIGSGMSASLAILLYFGLRWCRTHLPLLVYLLPTLFACGHFAKSFNLLEQAGRIEGSALWSTQQWLPDRAEIAQILSSLIGYEATPTSWQAAAFIVSFGCALAIILARLKPLTAALATKEATV